MLLFHAFLNLKGEKMILELEGNIAVYETFVKFSKRNPRFV
jgi:hypothetical protein